MPLISFKVELKLRWAKHCALSVLGSENENVDSGSNNVIFTIKVTKNNEKLSKL